jgi:nitrite reductase (NADH) small subunit
MKRLIPVAQLNELVESEGKAVRVNNQVIALFKLPSGEVYAVENSCPHVGAPLDNGLVEDKKLTCLWHSWCFDLETGNSTNFPGASIKTFPVKIENEQVFIEIE